MDYLISDIVSLDGDLYTRFEGAILSLLKCRSDPIGRGVRLKSEMLWVRVPPSVLDFISKHIRDWSNGKTRDSKPFDVGSIPTSRAMPW